MSITLCEALQEFLLEYENLTTRKGYSNDIKQLVAFTGDCPLEEITPHAVKMWRASQHERGLAQATVNGRVIKVKRFFNWAVEMGLLADNPARMLKVKRTTRTIRDKAAPKWLLDRMLETAQHQRNPFRAARDTALLAMLIQYGARRGDAASATLSRMNDTHFVLRTKGGHERAYPITEQFRLILDRYVEQRTALNTGPDNDSLFVSIRSPHRPLSAKAIEKVVRALSKQCGGNIGPHAIRHWFGQSFADARIPPTVTQGILGHCDVKITLDFYYNQGDDRMLRILEEQSGLERMSSSNVLRLGPHGYQGSPQLRLLSGR